MNKQKKFRICNLMCICYAAIYILNICTISNASESPTAFLDPEAILEGWESNYGSINSMKVSYCEQVLEARPNVREPDRYDNLVRDLYVERVENKEQYHIRCSMAKTGFEEQKNLMEHAFNGEITQEYWGSGKKGAYGRGLTGRNVETMNILKNYMLMDIQPVSGRYLQYFPSGKAPKLSFLFRLGLSAKILPTLEFEAGQWCHVVELMGGRDPGKLNFKLWIAHDKGMLPVKYQQYYENELAEEIRVEKLAFAETESGNIWYPAKAVRSTNWKDSGLIRYELTVKTFIPNVKTDKNTFRFDFPDGTKIVDQITGLYYTKGVDDIDGMVVRELNQPETEQNKSHKDIPFYKEVPAGTTNVQTAAKDSNIPLGKTVKGNIQNNIVGNSVNGVFATKKVMVFAVLIAVSSLLLLLWHKRYRKG